MFPNEVKFTVEKRIACRSPEWCLFIQFKYHDRWVLKTWQKKPTDEAVKEAQSLVLRSFEIYHRHIKIPSFNLRVTE